jgi:hypothetical protein
LFDEGEQLFMRASGCGGTSRKKAINALDKNRRLDVYTSEIITAQHLQIWVEFI